MTAPTAGLHDLACCGAWRIPLSNSPSPALALEALLPLDAALLESRTHHSGARYSYLACSPLVELRLLDQALQWSRAGQKPFMVTDQPVAQLFAALENVRAQPLPGEAPFTAGWIGYFAHEFGCRLLDTPLAQPAAPARPGGPLALFRLYRDVLVFDHHHQTVTLHGTDWGEGEAALRARLDALRERLGAQQRAAQPPAVVNAVEATLSAEQFAELQNELQALIRAGDCFQVNLTASWAWPWREPSPSPEALAALYRRYTEANPGAWCGFFRDDQSTLLCGSPELLVDWCGEALHMRPIAGTRARGPDAPSDAAMASELLGDPKERAEHAMLVDLVRNDLARVSRAGTVRVDNLAGVERYRHVMHLVSEVAGEADENLDVGSLIRAVFPGGTVTGTPKRRALKRIGEFERGPRGAYTGALGYVGLGGAVQFNLMIRTLAATATHLVAHAGCGIVEGSQSALEVRELEAKARAQTEAALGRATPATAEDRCGEVEAGPSWQPGFAQKKATTARVLIVDFEDSFVHNLADYCRRLGAPTQVASAHAPPDEAWGQNPSHLVLSPGPGRPDDFPAWRRHVALAQERRIPVLGVCLGHQALGEAAGARLICHTETVHGRGSPLRRLPAAHADPVFSAWKGESVGRYHSLVIVEPTSSRFGMEPLATLEDGTLMAVRYRDRPHWGLQFHPESLLTDRGLELVAAFLDYWPA